MCAKRLDPVKMDNPKLINRIQNQIPDRSVPRYSAQSIDSGPLANMLMPKTPCVNSYQQKKTFAQGLMDIALLLANARQLKDILEAKAKMPYYTLCLTLVSISLMLQIVVGGMLIWNSRFDVKNHHEMVRANRVNNLTVTSIFVITMTNVFISVFAGF